MLKNAVFDKANVELDKFTPFIKSTIIINTESTESDANAITAVIKNVFNKRFSFCLFAITIAKYMIDKNIKNSIIINITNKINTNNIDILSEITVEIIIFKKLAVDGE